MSLYDEVIHDCALYKNVCVCVRACVYVGVCVCVSSLLSLWFLGSAHLLGAGRAVPALVFRRSLDDTSTPPVRMK